MKKTFACFVVACLLACCFLLSGCKSEKLFDYDLKDYINVGDYKNLKVDTEGEKFKQGLAYANYQKYEKSDGLIKTDYIDDGVVQLLDKVTIDYVGKKDGVAFEGGTANDYSLQIGSSSFIEGFETGLIGVHTGKTVELNLTFPKEYNSKELAGKDVVFTVTVKGIERPVLTEMTDKVAKQLGYDSAKAYNDAVYSDYLKNTLWSRAVDNAVVIKYPEKEINYIVDEGMESVNKQAKESGESVSELLSSYAYTTESYKENITTYAKSVVKQRMVLYYIARNESFENSKSDIEEYMKNNNLEDTAKNQQTADESLLQQKVLSFLASNVG